MNAIPLGVIACCVIAATSNTSRPTKDAEYVAVLRPVNQTAAGTTVRGEMRFIIRGDRLTIHANVRDLPPNIEHWQHMHGFADGKQAQCYTAAADTNRDGFIDIRETEPAAGTTMIPFNADPVAMDIPTHEYPRASATGGYDYEKTVSLKALEKVFGQRFGANLDLDRRVVQVHGIPEETTLPPSVASLGPIPAHVTMPIACGVIKRITP